MILLVDIGNSRIKSAEWTEGRIGPMVAGSADEDAADAWSKRPRPATRPERVIVASVAGRLVNERFGRLLEEWWGARAEFLLTGETSAGVTNGYMEPARLGVDRWAAMVGAYHLAGSACCVVDCGSAITVDALSAEGEHAGGIIVPGLGMMRQSLAQNTAGARTGVPAQADATTGFGRNTSGCIETGTLWAAAGAVLRSREIAVHRFGPVVEAFITGGDADALLPLLGHGWRHEPALVLFGLARLAGLDVHGNMA